MYPILFGLLMGMLNGARTQLTAQSSVAPALRECYNNITMLNRNNLPPTSISVLIDIIRKIEDDPNVNIDLRQLAVLLLHTYRQDGIEYHQPETNLGSLSNVLPYAPTFHSFHRHRLLLTRLIPSNLQVLPNTTVSPVLKCALHHMLSTTVDARVRGDEQNCNQLSQYRAMRTARQTYEPNDDVEILDPHLLEADSLKGQFRQYNINDEVEYNNLMSQRQLLGESQCPLLDGVIKTPWGAVSAGHLIAGIAAGAEAQQVPVSELSKNTLNYVNLQQTVTSIYPATLSGDLAEAVLIQGTERGSSSISIGTAGNWNSTQASKHFMINSRINIEMTDPEIRGDVDGFVLGTALSSILGTYGSLKLSQLLDMYYSPRNGVFNPALRACNRRQLSQQYIVDTNLRSETYTFAAALDTNMPLRGTITGGLDELVSNAVSNFQTYLTNNLNDMNCITSESNSHDFRLKTNLYLVLDGSWPYQAVYPAISYILDSIDVNKFGSTVTLLSAFDGNVVINKTSLVDFHTEYTLFKHQSMLSGVNLLNTFTNIKNVIRSELDYEKTINYVGGNSTVVLFMLNSGNIQVDNLILEEVRIINETVPDLQSFFVTSTNEVGHLWNLVDDMNRDIITVALNSDGRNVEIAMNPVIDRIRTVGRRIVNSNCGSDFSTSSVSGTKQFEDNVEPGYINYYAVSPNYFYKNNENTKIRIARSGGSGVGSLVICYSRVVPNPRQISNNSGGVDENSSTCQTLQSSGNVEISLKDACNGYWTIGACPKMYISVQSVVGSASTFTATCTTGNTCRFPYNLRYQVQIEEFGCFSSAGKFGVSSSLIIAAFFISKW